MKQTSLQRKDYPHPACNFVPLSTEYFCSSVKGASVDPLDPGNEDDMTNQDW